MKLRLTKQQLTVLAGACIFQFALAGILMNSTSVIQSQIYAEYAFSMSRISAFSMIKSLSGAVFASLLSRLFFHGNRPLVMFGAVASVVLGHVLLIPKVEGIGWYIAPAFLCPISSIAMFSVPYVLKPWFPANSGTAAGFAMAFSGLGGILFNPITAACILWIGWKATIVVLGLLTLLLAAAGIYLIFRNPLPVQDGGKGPEEELSTQDDSVPPGAIVSVIICALCLSGATICAQTFNYIAIFARSIGYSILRGSTLLSFVMIGNIIGKCLYGTACDKIGTLGATMMMGALAALGFLFMLTFQSCFYILCAACILIGLLYSQCTLALSKCCTAIYGLTRGTEFVGIHSTINAALAAGGSLLIGLVFDAAGSFTLVFAIDILALLISISAAFLQLGRQKRYQKSIRKQAVL